MIGSTGPIECRWRQIFSPRAAWLRMMAHSSPVSGPGFSRMESGIPTLPISCRYPPRESQEGCPIQPHRGAQRDADKCESRGMAGSMVVALLDGVREREQHPLLLAWARIAQC